ncbi:MAG: DUF1848 domain-containing protein [Ignavibacteria bacterium]
MIISASRRTDIPAYYSRWFMSRINEGFCLVPNPFNSKQISLVNLTPVEVTAIVFWTRNPASLIEHLDILDKRGYKYYFQYTLNNYPKIYEPYNPQYEHSLKCFKELSSKIGKGRVIWRYDPIIITSDLSLQFHADNFSKICSAVSGYTKRVVISIVDDYKKTLRRLSKLNTDFKENQTEKNDIEKLLKFIVTEASKNGIAVESCAEAKDYGHLGIIHGKCIDDKILKDELGIDTGYKKDKSQRLECGCAVSRDIGMNNTCLMGCEYCYATVSHETSVKNRKTHNPDFPVLLQWELPEDVLKKVNDFKNKSQLNLWESELNE